MVGVRYTATVRCHGKRKCSGFQNGRRQFSSLITTSNGNCQRCAGSRFRPIKRNAYYFPAIVFNPNLVVQFSTLSMSRLIR
jgi:hypothetical protein